MRRSIGGCACSIAVIRHLIVRVDEELRVAERTRDARKATQARRRPRGLPPEPSPVRAVATTWIRTTTAATATIAETTARRCSDERERGGRGRGGRRGATRDKNKGGDRPRGGFFRRRRVCKFCAEKIDYINYKDVRLLTPFLPERGKIQPRRISGTCALHQRKLQTAIKRARQLALIP